MTVPYDQLQASTIKHFAKGMRDNIGKDHVYLYLLTSRNYAKSLYQYDTMGKRFPEGFKEVSNMGEKVSIGGVRYRKNSTSGTYSRFDTLDVTPQDNFTRVEYDWRNYNVNVHLCYEDLDKNRGDKVKLFDLMKGSIEDAMETASEEINDLLLGQAATTKDPFGLLDIIADDPSSNPSIGNLGGIDASAGNETWWRNQTVNHNSAAFGTSQSGTGFQNLRALGYALKFGSTKANVYIAGQTAFDNVVNAMVDQQRYIRDGSPASAIARAGFEVVEVNGIPLCLEKQIETLRSGASLTGDAIYGINFKHLKLWVPSYRWFSRGKTKEPVQQDSVVTPIISRMAHCTDARRNLGVMYAVV